MYIYLFTYICIYFFLQRAQTCCLRSVQDHENLAESYQMCLSLA